MKKSWTVIEYKEEYLTRVLNLINLVHKNYMNRELWNWKYFTGPFGKSLIFLVREKNQIIGLRPSSPRKILIKGKLKDACQFMDVMTHPDYRRQGIFTSLVEKSSDAILNGGTSLIYTFPNEKSVVGYKNKFDWKQVCLISMYVKPLNIKNLIKKYLKSAWLIQFFFFIITQFLKISFIEKRIRADNSIKLVEIESFDERINSFFQKVKSDYQIIIHRNVDYLNWRYCRNSQRKYKIIQAERNNQIVGYIVATKVDKFNIKLGIICEILSLSSDLSIAELLISEINKNFKNKNIELAACLMLKDKYYSKLLKKQGYRKIPNKLLPRKFYLFVKTNLNILFTRYIKNYRNWYITWGDIDTV